MPNEGIFLLQKFLEYDIIMVLHGTLEIDAQLPDFRSKKTLDGAGYAPCLKGDLWHIF